MVDDPEELAALMALPLYHSPDAPDPAPRPRETCARCGHTTLGCDTCGVRHPFLGASINGATYCHTWQTIAEHLRRPYVPTCYEAVSREMWADAGGRWLGTA